MAIDEAAQKRKEERARASDPVEVWREREERKRREQELAEHKWSLDEVQAFKVECDEDKEFGGAKWHSMQEFIRASHERGDFKYPWEFSRREFADYVGAGDKIVLSLQDYTDLTQHVGSYDLDTREYNDAILAFLRTLRLEGRVMHGPEGQSVPFADDTAEKRKARLDPIRKEAKAAGAIRKTAREGVARARALAVQQADEDLIRGYLREVQAKVAARAREVKVMEAEVNAFPESRQFMDLLETHGLVKAEAPKA